MSWPDDYREKVLAVRDSMRTLLEVSPEDGWITVRMELRSVNREIETDDRDRAREQAAATPAAPKEDPRATWRASQRVAHSIWTDLSRERREAAVLDLLGNDSRTIKELTEALDTKLRTPECDGCGVVYTSYLRAVVMRMWREGQLDRTPEPRGNSKTAVRYRYSVRRTLEGPIADLERAFQDVHPERES